MRVSDRLLLSGGLLTGVASLLHLGIILGGPGWYRFFGAGEHMARLAARGSAYPTAVTAGIAAVLGVWALYALSGAGVIRRLPLLRPALPLIAAVYLARGVLGVPAVLFAEHPYANELRARPTFVVVSSAVCVFLGLCYAAGAAAVWKRPSARGFMKGVEVVPHDPRWRDAFEAEAKRVAAALGETVAAVHHIGSTSIPGIYAKPVIDLLVEVRDVGEVDARGSAMESLGYEVMGEYGIPGRRYFRKDDGEGNRTHHVHAFEAGSAEAVRHLAFRDYMVAHPAEARRYSELKRRLAEENPQSIDGYMDGKDGFIKEMDRRAALWRASQAG